VNSIAISGSNIFVGAGEGVFLSTNNGSSWTAVNNGLPVSGYGLWVNSIAINGGYNFSGTYYGGVWKRPLSEIINVTGIDETDNGKIKVYPNPTQDFLVIDIHDYSSTPDYSIKIVNQLGTKVFETKIKQPQYKINTSSWSGKGVYILQV
jgi:hypothetical protein